MGPSQALAAARPDLVTMEHWDTARHTKEWNVDPERWERSVAEFVSGPDRATGRGSGAVLLEQEHRGEAGGSRAGPLTMAGWVAADDHRRPGEVELVDDPGREQAADRAGTALAEDLTKALVLHACSASHAGRPQSLPDGQDELLADQLARGVEGCGSAPDAGDQQHRTGRAVGHARRQLARVADHDERRCLRVLGAQRRVALGPDRARPDDDDVASWRRSRSKTTWSASVLMSSVRPSAPVAAPSRVATKLARSHRRAGAA